MASSKATNLDKSSKEKFTFFYKSHSPFSQWYKAKFSSVPFQFGEEVGSAEARGILEFEHCEQWMMYSKAICFKDYETADKILRTSNPAGCKRLGRQVKNFDVPKWIKVNKAIIYEGNRLKFTQNEDLLLELLGTQGTTLVEASPLDKIYGIGLSGSDPRALNRGTWKGRNLLGEVLTELREDLRFGGEDTSNEGASLQR